MQRDRIFPIHSIATLLGCLGLLLTMAGCASEIPDHAARMSRGYVYYCDGAGGGRRLTFGEGLRKGLIDGGWPGSGEIFPWNTGLGVLADQKASVDYKRRKARELAHRASSYTHDHPDTPVVLIGLSAGTAVTIFSLEELPPDSLVEDVVLCGASTSATYDLTRALEHVKHRLYIFTSEKDAVLSFLVPMAGTADRVSGRIPSAGLHGFSLPARASEWTRQQYAKSVTIPWRPDFAQLGYRGGHTDVLSAHFVAAQIAPRLMQEAGTTPAKLASTYDKVPNPDYERWAGFAVGSYSVMEGYQQYRDIRSAVRVKEILRSKSADRLELHREFFLTDEHATVPSHVLSVIAEAWIKPEYHPITDPAAVRSTLPAREISVKDRAYRCLGRRVEASGQYPDWGSDLVGTVYRAETLPGGIAMLELRSHLQGEPFVFEGRAVDFELKP